MQHIRLILARKWRAPKPSAPSGALAAGHIGGHSRSSVLSQLHGRRLIGQLGLVEAERGREWVAARGRLEWQWLTVE